MDNNDTLSAIGGFLMWAYFIVSQIMSFVFFIDYCRSDDSILQIIFIQEMIFLQFKEIQFSMIQIVKI